MKDDKNIFFDVLAGRKITNDAVPFRKKYEYFKKCICARGYAKKNRLWCSEKYFKMLYHKNLNRNTELQWKITKYSELVEIALRFFLLTGYVGTIIMLFYYLFQGEISIGAFVAIFSSLDQMFDRMETVFNYQIGSIMRNFGVAQNYYTFLDLKEREETDVEILKREQIELRNVAFFYRNSEKKVLKEINLTVRKGETVAIVRG